LSLWRLPRRGDQLTHGRHDSHEATKRVKPTHLGFDNAVANAFIGGWQLSTNSTIQSGVPMTLNIGIYNAGTNNPLPDRPSFSGVGVEAFNVFNDPSWGAPNANILAGAAFPGAPANAAHQGFESSAPRRFQCDKFSWALSICSKPGPQPFGTDEPERMRTAIQTLHNSFREANIPHIYYESPGTDHEWQTWRRDLKDLASRLFQ
jgi:hypothetical protein